MTLSSNDYLIFESGNPGKTTTVMAGVHGNERSGIRILEEIKDTLQVVQGKVYLIIQANPRAISSHVRQTEKNMNRAFHAVLLGETYEDLRAQELLPTLNASDILLDVHNTLNTENSLPFLISEHPEWDQYFPVDTVVSGLDRLHPGGSDGYMNSIGKVGLCIESGSIYFDDEGKIARVSILNFLRATGNIEGNPEIYQGQNHYILDTIVHSQTEQFGSGRNGRILNQKKRINVSDMMEKTRFWLPTMGGSYFPIFQRK